MVILGIRLLPPAESRNLHWSPHQQIPCTSHTLQQNQAVYRQQFKVGSVILGIRVLPPAESRNLLWSPHQQMPWTSHTLQQNQEVYRQQFEVGTVILGIGIVTSCTVQQAPAGSLQSMQCCAFGCIHASCLAPLYSQMSPRVHSVCIDKHSRACSKVTDAEWCGCSDAVPVTRQPNTSVSS
jgi:hypothetical protein